MNDWQRVYGMTESVTTAALLTVTRLRLAAALDKVTDDQVTAALAGGGDSIAVLLEAAEAPLAHVGLEEFAEAVDYSFHLSADWYRGHGMMAKQGMEPTAAQRLATAQDGLRRLQVESAAADGRKAAAQAQLDELTGKLAALQRAQDVRGEDVAAALLTVQGQRTEAARQVSIASATKGELAGRMEVVRRDLPALEAAALQDELAAASATGAEAARRYRAALEGFLAAAVVLQSDLAKCARLGDNIAAKGAEPRAKLPAHLVAGADLDRVLKVARDTRGEPAAVARAIGQLFDRWLI